MEKAMKKYAKQAVAAGAAALTVLSSSLFALAAQAQADVRKYLDESQLGTIIGGGSGDNLPQIIGAAISVILGLLGLILVILILWAGWMWMTSAGDADKVKKAKQIIYQAVIGLLIVFASYAIGSFVIERLQNIAAGSAS